MDAFWVQAAAVVGPVLFGALGQVAQKALVEPALARGTEPVAALVGQKYDRAKKEKALAEAIRTALKAALAEQDVPLEKEDRVAAYLQETGLIKLQTEKNPALQHLLARAVIGFSDPQAEPPEELRFALNWPLSRKPELSRLLVAIRHGLAAAPEWKEWIGYADQAEQRGLLQAILAQLTLLDRVLVLSEAGEALKVALVDIDLTPQQAEAIEAQYRQGLQDEYRMHQVTGLKQVQKAVRLPLQDIYVELGLIQLSGRDQREAEQTRLLAASEPERLAIEQAYSQKRVGNILGEAPRLVILGKPGSGKTTSLKFIALMLALGEAGTARLGLPAPYLPVFLRLVDYADALRTRPGLGLETFLRQYISDNFSGRPRQSEYLRLALEKGGCLLLLDGLDEVGDTGDSRHDGRTLRLRVLEQVQRFADVRCQAHSGNRIIVTSRLEGYQPGDLGGFSEVELSPLRWPDEVENFLLRWFTAYGQQSDAQLSLAAAEEQARRRHVNELIATMTQWESIRRLSTNPLLLTILAVIHETGKRLPHRRVELYETVATTIIENWREAMVKRPAHIYKDLHSRDVFHILSSLAYWLHSHRPGGTMAEAEWRSRLLLLLQRTHGAQAQSLVDDFLHHARHEVGLLTERSSGQIGFFHLTLEEYLAAVEIARQEIDDQHAMLAEHWHEPAWEEIILLTADELDYRGRERAAEKFLEALIDCHSEDQQQCGRPAMLAGRCLVDSGRVNPHNPLHQRVLDELNQTMHDLDQPHGCPCRPGRVTPRRRAEAGDLLGELGHVPEGLYQFVPVPDGERPKFWMARYPVTNRQYARFVDSADFADPTLWQGFPMFDEKGNHLDDTGWDDTVQKWLKDAPFESAPDGRRVISPRYWDDPRFGMARPNAPVVGLSWFEANAYCRWLQRTWAEREEAAANSGLQPHGLRLPTEQEWLLAAGGGEPKERYAWDTPGQATGDEAEIIRRCNVDKSGIGRTTPIDLYPDGLSPSRVWDMSGNVWEWQANDMDGQQRVLGLRGGAWYLNGGYARPAVRNWSAPAFLWDYHVGFRPLLARP